MTIYQIVSRTGYTYALGETINPNVSITVTEILLMPSACSTRICRVSLDNGNYIEVNDPVEIWYMPQ